jgi:hypothetical protein
MSDMNRIRKYFGTMSRGERQYMANKLWKDAGVVAQKLEIYIPEDVLRPEVEVKRKRGDRFDRNGETYILVSVNARNMGLVSLVDGNRWTDDTHVVSPRSITPTEWIAITADQPEDFTKKEVA